jgi:hypothetical protein
MSSGSRSLDTLEDIRAVVVEFVDKVEAMERSVVAHMDGIQRLLEEKDYDDRLLGLETFTSKLREKFKNANPYLLLLHQHGAAAAR